MLYIFVCVFVSVSSCCVLVYKLTYVHECFIGKEFSYYEKGTFQYILSNKLGKKWLYQLEVFHNIVFLPTAKERGNLLPDNIKINQIDKS